MGAVVDDVDVIVVGAGPAGASAAHYCATQGLNVAVLEKAEFPRDKICGDGLTPRAVKELAIMGIGSDAQDGWIKNRGLRVIGGGHRLELEWPDVTRYPEYGMARPRASFDHTLIQHAVTSGAKLYERTNVSGPVVDERTGRVLGVRVKDVDESGKRTGTESQFRAPVVIAADGVSARFATSMGIAKRDDRPMGVAVRTYYKTPNHDDQWMESHLELWEGKPNASKLLPGYGWIFPLGDGTANVGLGSVSSTADATKIDYKALFEVWMQNAPEGWDFTSENRLAPVRGAALPMGFNRTPMYARGTLLAGDAGGMVSPFNGEGIAYALQAGRVGAEVISLALTKSSPAARDRALATYAQRMRDDIGGYFTLGRYFVKIIEHPQIMRWCVKHGLGIQWLMPFVMKLLSDCYDPHGGDTVDRVITALTKVVPRA